MTFYRCLVAAGLALGSLFATAGDARAETFNTCAGFIASVPVTITTQGVWCLTQDLATNVADGSAITIATNNVTIDCNQFKLGGLAAGNGSIANGIHALNRQNVSIRNCNIRGFFQGILLDGADGAGHLVEDNRLDNNLFMGIHVKGENNLIRRNLVHETGGSALKDHGVGIQVLGGDVFDNSVDGVFGNSATFTDTYGFGIIAIGTGIQVSNNRVRELKHTGSGHTAGIDLANTTSAKVTDNFVSMQPATNTQGIRVLGGAAAKTICSRNIVIGNLGTTAMTSCINGGGNISY